MKLYRWQAITNGYTVEEQLSFAQDALSKGCKWIQFRYKQQSEDTLIDVGKKIRTMCIQEKATFIVNDHIWLAKLLNADGVHLGLTDASVVDARQILGYEKIVGGTANTIMDIETRITAGVDYIGLGPYKYTTTKEKLSPILGLSGYEQILNTLDDKRYACPIFAIGGIGTEDILPLFLTGISGIAASSLWRHIQSVDELDHFINK